MPTYKHTSGIELGQDQLLEQIAPYALKFYWFNQCGYSPHYWQSIFHSLTNGDKLCRFRHLVAGRRGGKTLAAAWEVLFYATHPDIFHRDAHNTTSDRPLHIWILAPDHVIGRASYLSFHDVLRQSKLEYGKDYKENKAHRWVEFPNNTLIEFKTADEPEKLRGAGLDILWIDESAIIPSEKAYEVARPALSDKTGLVVCTTTPLGKNWYYDEFWSDEALADPNVGRVEYRSIDNPYFPAEEWQLVKRTYHPLLFKQEYMAAFDSMAGKELPGEWLSYYKSKDLPRDLKFYMGVDPAISLADTADRFAAVLIGVTPDNTQLYLVDIFAGRIPFPEQVQFIREWHMKYRPILIGIESVAYQTALVQQTQRLDTLPPIIPMMAKGKKSDRILAMAPLFKIGKVKLQESQDDFIDEWLDFDSTLRNPKDDVLDATEIALRTAGALLPITYEKEPMIFHGKLPLDELVRRDLPSKQAKEKIDFDIHLGGEW